MITRKKTPTKKEPTQSECNKADQERQQRRLKHYEVAMAQYDKLISRDREGEAIHFLELANQINELL